MAESFISGFPEDHTNRTRKKKKTLLSSSIQQVQESSQRLYSRQLEGKTTRQLVLEHAKIEGIAETSAWKIGIELNNGITKIGKKIEKICFQDFKQ